MGALMLLQAAKAFFVAANTAVNLLDLPGGHFVRPFRVSQQLAAHGSTGDASACKLLFYKIRLIQPTDTRDGLVRVEWFASVTWKLVTPASVSSGTKIPSSDSTTPALP